MGNKFAVRESKLRASQQVALTAVINRLSTEHGEVWRGTSLESIPKGEKQHQPNLNYSYVETKAKLEQH